MKTQKESVFQAIVRVCGEVSDSFIEPTSEQLQEVYAIVTSELDTGEAYMKPVSKEKYDSAEKLRKLYVPGMVANWLRRDTRLNGGSPYQTKNPGKNAGRGDDVLKNLKALKSITTDIEQVALIDDEIAKRLAALKKDKVKEKEVEVNYECLPPELLSQLHL